MTTVSSVGMTRDVSVVVLIEQALVSARQRMYDVNLAIERLKSRPGKASDFKRDLNRLSQEQIEIYKHISNLHHEQSRAVLREAAISACERVMQKALYEINLNNDMILIRRGDWVKAHAKRQALSTLHIAKLIKLSESLHSNSLQALKGMPSRYAALSREFEEEYSRVIDSCHVCPSVKVCRSITASIRRDKLVTVRRVGEFLAAQEDCQKIMAQDRAAYGKISQECKI